MADGWDQFQDAPQTESKADQWSGFADAPKGGDSEPSTISDIVRSVPGALAKGLSAVLGTGGDVRDLGVGTIRAAGNFLSPGTGDKAASFADTALRTVPVLGAPDSQDISDTVSKPFGGYYLPKTTAGRYAETIVSFAPALLGGEETIGMRLARTALAGTASETAGEATEGTPYEPYARVAGAVLGDAGIPLAKASWFGGKTAIAPMRAALSPDMAESLAGQKLASHATDLDALKTSLSQDGKDVPGSAPTTFQQSGDMGIGEMERAAATKNPGLFNQRRAEQNAARVAALKSVQAGGDPNDVSSFLKDQFKDLSDQTDQHFNGLIDEAKTAGGRIAGAGATPEAQGSIVRDALQSAETSARSREGTLWKAVDPHGDLTGNLAETATAAKDIVKSIGPTAKPMAGEEQAIFHAASELPPIAPVSQLVDLRSRVSTEMRNELIANGRSPTYARLARLRGAIQDNLASSISQQVANDDAAASRGVIAPENTILERLKGWVNDYKQRQAQSSGASVVGGPAEQSDGSVGVNGTGFPTEGGFGSAAGNSRVPAVPTFDQSAADRLKDATAATKERARTFGNSPIASVLAKNGLADSYKLKESSVPDKFFHPGPTGYQDMQAFYKAAGPDKGLPLAIDFASSSLRRAAMREDGTIDPAKYSRWAQTHSDALRALPEDIRNQFSTAAKASQAVSDAAALRELALKDAQSGAIGDIMKAGSSEDVTRRIGSILGAKNSVSQMKALADQASKSPYAMQGLRQAVADHLANNLISNTEAATSGENLLKADQFQTFIKKNRAALAQVFKPSEIESLEAVAADLRRSNRSITAVKIPGGSNTAQDTFGVGKDAKPSSVLQFALNSLGGAAGFHAFGTPGAFIGYMGMQAVQAMRESGIQKVNDLVTKALLDPAVAKALLMKVPTRPNTGSAVALARALRRSVVAGALAANTAPRRD